MKLLVLMAPFCYVFILFMIVLPSLAQEGVGLYGLLPPSLEEGGSAFTVKHEEATISMSQNNFGSMNHYSQSSRMRNLGTGTYLAADVSQAHGLEGSRELSMNEQSAYVDGGVHRGFYQESSSMMVVNETVTEGHVNFRVLQLDTQNQTSGRATPLIDIDEDYIGTYHLEKNMSISSEKGWQGIHDWLHCCQSIPVYGLWSPKAAFDCSLRP